MKIRKNVILAPHTTFRIGGPADYFLEARTESDLVKGIKWARNKNINFFILGGGSNILISSKGYRGLVIKNKTESIVKKGLILWTDSGVITNRLVNFSIKNSLKGLENFSGLPGTIGGAVYKNSHFKTFHISDNLEKVKVLNVKNQIKVISKDSLHFSYDYSSFQKTRDIILKVSFKLSKGNRKSLEKVSQDVISLRINKHPIREKSAGCVFKNPDNKPAGMLIEKAGLKGKKIGQAMVSLKHAAFIVNTGHANSEDVLKLIKLIKEKVAAKFSLNLEEEIFLIGEF